MCCQHLPLKVAASTSPIADTISCICHADCQGIKGHRLDLHISPSWKSISKGHMGTPTSLKRVHFAMTAATNCFASANNWLGKKTHFMQQASGNHSDRHPLASVSFGVGPNNSPVVELNCLKINCHDKKLLYYKYQCKTCFFLPTLTVPPINPAQRAWHFSRYSLKPNEHSSSQSTKVFKHIIFEQFQWITHHLKVKQVLTCFY